MFVLARFKWLKSMQYNWRLKKNIFKITNRLLGFNKSVNIQPKSKKVKKRA